MQALFLPYKGAVVLPAGTFEAGADQPVVLREVACNGNETSLDQCSHSTSSGECSEQGAAVVCQGKPLDLH